MVAVSQQLERQGLGNEKRFLAPAHIQKNEPRCESYFSGQRPEGT